MNNYIKNNTGILIRIDDVCENMDWELMKKLEVLFDKHSIKPVLGVIPNNKDEGFLSFSRNDFEIGIGSWKNTTILKDEIKIKANIFLFKE